MENITNLKIRKLELEIKELKEAHIELSQHYREFVKATVNYLKQNTEEE